jgi:hypothetical protein
LTSLRRGVDLPDAGDALVGVDEDDEVVLTAVCDPLVHGGLPQDDRLDVGDLHAGLSIMSRLSTISREPLRHKLGRE